MLQVFMQASAEALPDHQVCANECGFGDCETKTWDDVVEHEKSCTHDPVTSEEQVAVGEGGEGEEEEEEEETVEEKETVEVEEAHPEEEGVMLGGNEGNQTLAFVEIDQSQLNVEHGSWY
jgi:hypothetical protein